MVTASHVYLPIYIDPFSLTMQRPTSGLCKNVARSALPACSPNLENAMAVASIHLASLLQQEGALLAASFEAPSDHVFDPRTQIGENSTWLSFTHHRHKRSIQARVASLEPRYTDLQSRAYPWQCQLRSQRQKCRRRPEWI